MSLLFRFMDWQLSNSFLSALKQLTRELYAENGDTIDSKELLSAIHAQAQVLYDANIDLIVDEPGSSTIRISALALAAYRQLIVCIGDRKQARQLVQAALLRPQKSQVQSLSRLMLRLSRNPLALMATISKKKQLDAYGKGFTFTTHSDNMKSYYVTYVHRCLYHEFFKANGAAELTLAFCAFDNLWGDLLQNGEYGVYFSRPTTIAAGDDMCRFEFSRAGVIVKQSHG